MKLGIAADHGGFALKQELAAWLTAQGHELKDYGAFSLDPADDFPDFIVPLAKGVSAGAVERGIAVCGSGVGASVAANKVKGVRAALVVDTFSAHQGVEDDDMNVMCLGHKASSLLPDWHVVGVEVVDRDTFHTRGRTPLAPVSLVGVAPF